MTNTNNPGAWRDLVEGAERVSKAMNLTSFGTEDLCYVRACELAWLKECLAAVASLPEPDAVVLMRLRNKLNERRRYYCDDKQSGHLNATWLAGQRDALEVLERWLDELAGTEAPAELPKRKHKFNFNEESDKPAEPKAPHPPEILADAQPGLCVETKPHPTFGKAKERDQEIAELTKENARLRLEIGLLESHGPEPKATSATVDPARHRVVIDRQEFLVDCNEDLTIGAACKLVGKDSSTHFLYAIRGDGKPDEWMNGESWHKLNLWSDNRFFTAPRIINASARAEAKEAPEPERRDALLRLKEKCEQYEKSLIPHYRWYKLMEDIDKELAKQPAKEAPESHEHACGCCYGKGDKLQWACTEHVKKEAAAGEEPPFCSRKHVTTLMMTEQAAHAELSKAGIPEGALDERVRHGFATLNDMRTRWNELVKDRDEAVRERDHARNHANNLGDSLANVLRERDAARQDRINMQAALDEARAEVERLRKQCVCTYEHKSGRREELSVDDVISRWADERERAEKLANALKRAKIAAQDIESIVNGVTQEERTP